MNTSSDLQLSLADYVEERRDHLIEIARELIRKPSENTPPHGAEAACQEWIAQRLTACRLQPDLYPPTDVPEFTRHRLYLPGRDYTKRPNLGVRRAGAGGGRSLILSGHIDTVPRGTQEWTRDPFGAEIEGNRIYGRGSCDMKAGIAANLFVLETIVNLGLTLAGDLLFESVVDEEFGGSNGTLAARLRGYHADAAILAEPTSLRICPAQRGGRTAHLVFRASANLLDGAHAPDGVISQLTHFLGHIQSFASERAESAPFHEMYKRNAGRVPVSVTKVITSPWGYREPITIPEMARIEMYWQMMPGENQAEIEEEFFSWLRQLVKSAPEIYPAMPEVSFPFRWLPGSSVSRSEPVVQEFSACVKSSLGFEPAVAGMEGPCDLFLFQREFGIPAVLWGPSGGNIHSANEFVEIDSLVAAAKALLVFVVEWCGLSKT